DDWPSQPEEIGLQNLVEGVAAIPFHLQKHAGFRDSLVFLGENQGGALWAVYLDGNQDPLVLVTNEIDWSDVEHPRTKWWLPCAKSFSEFVYCRLFLPAFASTGVSLYSPGRLLWREDFEFLRDNFVEHPYTMHRIGVKEYRFSLKGDETIRLQITD